MSEYRKYTPSLLSFIVKTINSDWRIKGRDSVPRSNSFAVFQDYKRRHVFMAVITASKICRA
jgi:hypothetical protein